MYFTYTFHFSSSDWRLQRDSIQSDWVQTEGCTETLYRVTEYRPNTAERRYEDCRDWDSIQSDQLQTEHCRETLYRVTAEYRLKTAERLYTEWPPQSIDLKTVERLYTKWLSTDWTLQRDYIQSDWVQAEDHIQSEEPRWWTEQSLRATVWFQSSKPQQKPAGHPQYKLSVSKVSLTELTF